VVASANHHYAFLDRTPDLVRCHRTGQSFYLSIGVIKSYIVFRLSQETFKIAPLLLASMRLLFYAINGVGLGHVRRLLLIAEEIRKQKAEVHILFITNSAFPQMIEEKGFPYVCIPYEQNLDAQSFFPLRTISTQLHDSLFRTVVRNFSPDVVVCDLKWPVGLLKLASGSSMKTVILLRKEETPWLRKKLPALKRFDLVCVPHTREEYKRIGTPEEIIRQMEKMGAVFTGPVLPQQEKQPLVRDDGTFRILVTAGGGGWSTTKRFLELARESLTPLMRVHKDIVPEIVLGPLFKGEFSFPHARVHRYLKYGTMTEKMGQSHLAISRVGYNTCNDLLLNRLPAILVPIAGEVEQVERAADLERAGCALVAPDGTLRDTVEKLYKDRTMLKKMRKACCSVLGKSGTSLIAKQIISLIPEVKHVTLGKPLEIKKAEFVVASGKPSRKAMKQLAQLRKRAGILIFEADFAWLNSSESVNELTELVDAVVLQLTPEQSRKVASQKTPKGLRQAISLLGESGLYFEVRIEVGPALIPKIEALARELHEMGCPQIHFLVIDDIDQNALGVQILEIGRSVLIPATKDIRLYCSQSAVLPSEFPKERILSYRMEQLLKKRKELEHTFKKLEKSKTLKRWYKVQGKDDALPKAVRRIDRRLGELNARKECFAALLPKVGFLGLDELPPELDKGVASQWRAVLREQGAVEEELIKKQELYLSAIEKELDDVLLKQEEFKDGKTAGMTWRQLDLKRQRLISRHRSLWVEHLSALDERRRLVNARKRMFAEELQAELEALIHQFERDINKTLSKRHEALKRHQQEITRLSQSKELKRYHLLRKQRKHMDKRIITLNEKISAVYQQLERLG